jgi:hypothetical protein
MGEVYGATVLVKGERTTTQESLRSPQIEGTTVIRGDEGRLQVFCYLLLSI